MPRAKLSYNFAAGPRPVSIELFFLTRNQIDTIVHNMITYRSSSNSFSFFDRYSISICFIFGCCWSHLRILPFHGNGWTERERTVSLTWQSNQRAQPSAKSLQKSEEGKAIRIDKRTWRDLILRVWKRVSRWLSIKTTISLFFSSNYITYCNVVKENTPLVDLIDV